MECHFRILTLTLISSTNVPCFWVLFFTVLMSQTNLNTGLSEMAQWVEHLTRFSKGQGSNPCLVRHYFFHPITGQFNNTCLIFWSNYNKLLNIFFIGYSVKDLIYCKLYFASHLNCSLCLELSIENKLLTVLKWSTLSIIIPCYKTTLYCVKYSSQTDVSTSNYKAYILFTVSYIRIYLQHAWNLIQAVFLTVKSSGNKWQCSTN